MPSFEKYAEILAELQPHQTKAVERALKNNLLLAHSPGSGKTLTSIAIADRLGQPATVLTPASLVENYKKEINNFKKGGPPIEVISLPTAVSRGYKIPKGNTLIIDEVHSLRNPGSQRYKYIQSQLPNAGRVFGLTGTPAYNDIANWAPLVNVVAKSNVFPESPYEFNRQYTQEVPQYAYGPIADYFLGIHPGSKLVLKNERDLKKKLTPYVDVFETDVEKPDRIDETISVRMSPEQQKVYEFVSGNIPNSMAWKLRQNLPPSKAESQELNAYLSGVRQVSNTPTAFDTTAERMSPKLKASVEQIKKHLASNPKLRAFVYSNYLDSGVNPVSDALTEAGISNAIFHGGLSKAQKKELVDEYNKGNLHVLLGTGSASEGLDLKKTNVLQLLEPHFNNARLEQVIGRGIRYKSHEGLPPDQRKVLVQRFESTMEPSWWDKLWGKKNVIAVDQYLKSRADEKDELINSIKNLFKK